MGARGQSSTDSLINLLAGASDDLAKAELNLEIGDAYLNSSPEQAMLYYQNSIVLAKKLQDTSILVSCLLGICDVHSTFEENKDALSTIYQALDIAKNNNESLALCYNRLSIIYFQLGDAEKSLDSDKQSLIYNRLLNDSAGIAFDLHNIGTYFMEHELFDSAMHYYQNSNLIAQNIDKELPVYNTSRMGLIYFRTKQYHKAITQQLKAIEGFTENKMFLPLANEETYLAQSYFELKDLDKATKYSEQSLKQAIELSHWRLLIRNYTMLMQISKEKNQFEKALNYSLLINAYADSISAKNNANLVQNMEAKHKYAQQKQLLELSEAKNKLLQGQKKLYSILVILSILLILIGSAFILILFRDQRINKRLLRELNFANKSKSKLLSLTGHDLRNSIGTLKGFTDLLSSNEISETDVQKLMPEFVAAVDSSYDLLDNLVTWGRHNQEGLKPNFQNLNSNALIEQTIKHVQQLARLKNISITTNNAGIEFKGDSNMISTVIRNLVSNAIKFSKPGTEVAILAVRRDKYIDFLIQDEGVGLSQENIQKLLNPEIEFTSKGTLNESGSGLGINLCQSFIHLHGGNLSIESEENNGSTFKFCIPGNIDL